MEGKDMMNKNLLMVLVFVLFLISCGGVKETIAPTDTPHVKYIASEHQVEIKGVRKVAIFPFADYSHQQDFLEGDLWGGNIRILEEITDHFVAHGIAVTVQEDVNTLLVDNDIIQPIPSQYLVYGSGGDNKAEFRAKVIGTPEYDLVNVEHSKDMKDEIINIIRDEMALEKAEKPPIQTSILQGATVGLSREMIKELGEQLGVDLIVRGRIIEYGFKEIDTYNPLQRGFLPVLIEPMKDVLFGATEAKKYESDLEDVNYLQLKKGEGVGFLLDQRTEDEDFSRVGEAVGYLFGQKTEDDVESTWDAMMEHSFGTISNLYTRKKRVSSIVQIRVYVQDVRTGDVLWSNRVETEYVPTTGVSFNSKHPKNMFDRNIKRCVKLLMDDLFSCVSPATKKIIELKESISEKQAPISDQEEIAIKELERRLSENKVLMKDLQAKIGTLENSKKILLQQVEERTLITMPNAILFHSGSSSLNEQGIKPLNTISRVLERYPHRDICIEGHTDNVPIGPKIKKKYATNWELSTARAITVKNHMVKNFRLNQSRIAVKGYGPFKPIASNDTPEGKAKNRRVVIVVGPKI